ncbi:MAG: RNP-1 like RNA-binding protein [Candidatus Magasanikbacteria bacterium]|nr:RNP-1 like RNA-binding protein [Candidatus Magasanikbacteria bacterium]
MDQNPAKLFVGNLSYQADEASIRDLFSQHGTVSDLYLPPNKGFAFVTMGSVAEADAAMNALNNADHMGRSIKVDKARPPKPRSDFGGGDRGGRGGGGRGGYGGGGGGGNW